MEYVRRPTEAHAARWSHGYDAMFNAFMRRHKLIQKPHKPTRYSRRQVTPPGFTELYLDEYQPWVVVEVDSRGQQVVTRLSDADFARWFEPCGHIGLARHVAVEAARAALSITDADWINAEMARRDQANDWGHPAERAEWVRIRDLVTESDTLYVYTYDPEQPERTPKKPPAIKVTDSMAQVLQALLDAGEDVGLSHVEIGLRTGLFRKPIWSATTALVNARWVKIDRPDIDHPARYRLTEAARAQAIERLARRAKKEAKQR